MKIIVIAVFVTIVLFLAAIAGDGDKPKFR